MIFLFSIFLYAENGISKFENQNVSVSTNLSETSERVIDLNHSVVEGSETLYSDSGLVLSSPVNYSIYYNSGKIVVRSYFDSVVSEKTLNIDYTGKVRDEDSIFMIQQAVGIFKALKFILVPLFFFMFVMLLMFYAERNMT